MHAEGLVLPELKLAGHQAIPTPMLGPRNIVIITINGANLGNPLIEHIAVFERARLI